MLSEVFIASLHNFKSARDASLSENGVNTNVYDTLLKEVNKHLDLLHRYVSLRKKILKLDDLQMWDMYVPLTGKPALSYRNALSGQFHELKYKENQCCFPSLKVHMDQYHKLLQNKRQ